MKKKKKFNTQQIFAIVALIAMIAMFVTSCLAYM